MAEITWFDDIDGGNSASAPRDPIWAMDLDDEGNEKEVLRWLNAEVQFLITRSEERIRKQRRNLALYKGIQYETQELRQDRRDIGESRSAVFKKIVANHLYDLTKNRVSRLIKYKPAVAILPTNDEFSDKVSAKMTKALLDHIWYNERFEGELSYQVATHAMIFGECAVFTEWDPSKGDLSPVYKKSKEKAKGGKIPLLGENGEQKKDGLGNPLWVDKPVRVGDVTYEIPMASEVFYEAKQRWQDVDYLFVHEVMPVDEARAMYRDKASKIKATENAQFYDYEKMVTRPSRNEVSIFKFYHRRTDFIDGGRYIVFTPDAILSSTEFPYSHRHLPCVRFTDLDIPGEVHGYSFFEMVKGLTGTYNNLTNLILRNQILVSHPKWMLPAGSAKLDQLGNDVTVVQYKGPQPPVLVQSNPTPSEVFQFRDALKEEFQQISGVFGVSRGEPPAGIKAGVALQFLSEQESERFNELVLKWNEFVRQLAEMTIAVAGDYYEASDERMIRVVGKNQAWMTMFFDVAHLSKDYDIRVQNSSALPQSKAARTQTLLDLNQQFPNELTGAQVLDMLDLGQSDKFVDAITVAVRTAEAENEQLTDPEGKEISPEESDDHVQHWKIHARQLQEFGFKYGTPDELKQRLKDHIMVHEMFMMDKAKTNPMFGQMLAQDPVFKQFPLFYVPEPIVEQAPTMAPEQAAQAGEMFPVEQGLPTNPELGGEAQALTNEPMPSLEEQAAMEQAIPQAPGIEPTGAI